MTVSKGELTKLRVWLENQKMLATKALRKGDSDTYKEILDNIIALKRLVDAQAEGSQPAPLHFDHEDLQARQKEVDDALKHLAKRAEPAEEARAFTTWLENQKMLTTKAIKKGDEKELQQRLGRLLGLLENYKSQGYAGERRAQVMKTLDHIKKRAATHNPELLADPRLFRRLQNAA